MRNFSYRGNYEFRWQREREFNWEHFGMNLNWIIYACEWFYARTIRKDLNLFEGRRLMIEKNVIFVLLRGEFLIFNRFDGIYLRKLLIFIGIDEFCITSEFFRVYFTCFKFLSFYFVNFWWFNWIFFYFCNFWVNLTIFLQF